MLKEKHIELNRINETLEDVADSMKRLPKEYFLATSPAKERELR